MTQHQLKSKAFDIGAESHIGLMRKTNQDRFHVRQLSNGSVLMAVADGLGGVPAGDMASDLVIEAVAQVENLEIPSAQQQLADLAVHIDNIVADAQQGDPELGGMGSTLILVWLHEGWAFWAHVGDSRLYLLRERQLVQTTRDQTLARFLVAEGEISPEQAKEHYANEVMNQCLGCGFCEPETDRFKLARGDVLLLSSDGLHRSVARALLERVLNSQTSIKTKMRLLLEAALDAGGRDNITGILAKINHPNWNAASIESSRGD